VRVAASGVVREDPRGFLEICADPAPPCAGVRLEGPALTPGPERVRIVGDFDGATLHATAEPEPAPDTPLGAAEFPVPCPEPGGGWPPYPGHELSAIAGHVEAAPDRYGGRWLGDGSVLVVAVPRGTDLAAAEAELRALDPSAPLCVTEVAYSTAELEAARAGAQALLEQRGAAVRWSSGDVLDNRSIVDVWRVDQATLDDIEERWGDAVEVFASFVVLDGPLARVPSRPAADDPNAVAIEVADVPSSSSLLALGRFTLYFDAAADCFVFLAGEQRVLPVWPYGTTATRTPAAVVDADGGLWQDGETRDVGGGVAPGPPDPAASCGATDSWLIGAGPWT
jgi:hypothetical protein